MNINRCREVLGTATLLLAVGHFAPAFGISSVERWEIKVSRVTQNQEMQDAGLNTRTIPVGPTGIEAIITEENPAFFTVKYVFKNSPASGKIKAGDLICGANGKRLETAHVFGKKRQWGNRSPGMAGPLTEMAPLIEASQGSDGKLDLMVHPGGNTKVTEKVTIQIKPVGRFSATYPYNCPRSDKLVTELCEIIERDIARGGRPHALTHMQLALMASGEKKYDSLIKEQAHRTAGKKAELLGAGFPSWGNGYEGIFLGEYYLKTRDKTVLPRMEQLNIFYRDGIDHAAGGFSHRSRPTIVTRIAGGGPPGYGSMAAPGALAMLAMSLFRAGGVPYDEFTYERIHQAYLRSTSESSTGGGYGFSTAPCIQIDVKDPKQGLSGRGVGFRCPTGMKDITDYEIKGVGLWGNSDPNAKAATQWMWKDTSWLEKERDSNIVEQWGGNRRMVIRGNVIPEPTKPYNTSKGNSQASCGMGALSHLIGNKDRKSWEYLAIHAANSSALDPEGWFQGHCSGGMHQLWQALGAARADKEKFRAFMDHNKWWFIMMQTHDGSYMTCPNRDRADQDVSYGPYTIPTANAAIILALSRRQLQITGAEGPAGGYTPSSTSSSAGSTAAIQTSAPQEAPAVKVQRQARSLSSAKQESLDGALLRTLTALSDAKQLKHVPLSMAFTRSKVWLKSASSEGEVEFQIVGGSNVAQIKWKDLGAPDRSTLALLVAHLKADSNDAQAMAGIYMETLGKVEQADQYYTKAGDASRKKLEALFD